MKNQTQNQTQSQIQTEMTLFTDLFTDIKKGLIYILLFRFLNESIRIFFLHLFGLIILMSIAVVLVAYWKVILFALFVISVPITAVSMVAAIVIGTYRWIKGDI